MKRCLASRITTFRSMNALPWPRGWRSCMSDALAAHYAGFGLADPTSPRLARRWPLPAC
jgi:hypothetical protein